MDVISIAASIVGLIGAATKVASILNETLDLINEEPKILVSLRNEINDTSTCLKRIQRLLLAPETAPAQNTSLLMVEDVVVILSNCVLIFSELEKMTDSLRKDCNVKAIRIYTWATKKKEFAALLTRLQSAKISLNLALTTMTW